jgi:DNA mismatch repair protein MSH2
MIGAAFINHHERRMLITEFLDNEHLAGLESLIIQQNNSAADSKFKVLIQSNDVLQEKLQDTLQMCEVEFAFSNDKKEWDHKNVNLALDKLLKDSFAYLVEESSMELALSALNAAISHSKLTEQCQNSKQKFTLSKYTLSNYLRLDVAALKALNVFPGSSSNESVSG